MAEAKKKDTGYRIVLTGFQGAIRILIYILMAVILIYFGRRAYTIGYQVVRTEPVAEENGADVTVTITDDMSVREIGQLLNDWGLIDEEPVSFVLQEFLSEYHNQILPGSYVLNTGMSVDEMLAVLSQAAEEDQGE